MAWVMDSLGWSSWLAGRPTPSARRAGPAAPPPTQREQTEQVRTAMLAALGEAAGSRPLQLKLAHAADAETLWHLRNELMAALAARHGEACAASQLARLTPLFRNLLPQGLACRLGPPAGLARHP